MPKVTLGITGLPEILGRDYGIEKPYWGPSIILPSMTRTPDNSNFFLFPLEIRIMGSQFVCNLSTSVLSYPSLPSREGS